MTRINVVPPAVLCDQHLLAEHRELTRIPNAEALESEGCGTCDWCGEELPMSELTLVSKNEWQCAACKKAEVEEEDGICGHCNGSGEGQYDGTLCGYCHGLGVEK